MQIWSMSHRNGEPPQDIPARASDNNPSFSKKCIAAKHDLWARQAKSCFRPLRRSPPTRHVRSPRKRSRQIGVNRSSGSSPIGQQRRYCACFEQVGSTSRSRILSSHERCGARKMPLMCRRLCLQTTGAEEQHLSHQPKSFDKTNAWHGRLVDTTGIEPVTLRV